jgi:hypothetical protein
MSEGIFACPACGRLYEDSAPELLPSTLEERVGELETEIQQLKAELRQYQPSDGMMYKLLGLNDVIREAAELLQFIVADGNNAVEAGLVSPMTEHVEGQIDAWLKHPTVVRAVTSPLAQAKVKP